MVYVRGAQQGALPAVNFLSVGLNSGTPDHCPVGRALRVSRRVVLLTPQPQLCSETPSSPLRNLLEGRCLPSGVLILCLGVVSTCAPPGDS